MRYQILRTNGKFPYHVVDENGLPNKELTIYACLATKFHSLNTAKSYTREVIAFASWVSENQIVKRQTWSLFGDSNGVRSIIAFFLSTEMRCVVAIGIDRLGYEIRKIQPTWHTGKRLEKLLAALRSFYSVLKSSDLYPYPNPMEGTDARELIELERNRFIADFVKTNGRNPMPVESGVDNVQYRRSSGSYFRLRDEQWLPEIIDDPCLYNTVLEAGEKWGWTLREQGLVRILFDSGCRIHEVCALTMADWFESKFGKTIKAISKGSHGLRVKRLFLADSTVKVLHRYVNEIRPRHSITELRTLSRKELETEPLFLTCRGTAVSPDHFRRNFWTPALRLSNLKLRPHQVRHWFVTLALNEVHQTATSEVELQHLRGDLKELMAWKSDMLSLYDQATTRHDLPMLAMKIHQRVEVQQKLAMKEIEVKSQVEVLKTKSEAEKMLDEMLGV